MAHHFKENNHNVTLSEGAGVKTKVFLRCHRTTSSLTIDRDLNLKSWLTVFSLLIGILSSISSPKSRSPSRS